MGILLQDAQLKNYFKKLEQLFFQPYDAKVTFTCHHISLSLMQDTFTS